MNPEEQLKAKVLGKWEPDFRKRTQNFTHGPVIERKVQDIGCVVVFFVILIVFFGFGGYCLNQTVKALKNDAIDFNVDMTKEDSNKYIGALVGLSILAMVLCVVFVLLTKYFPKFMVYMVIACVSLMFVALAGVSFYIGATELAFVFVGIMAIYFALLCCCFRKHLKTAIVLVKISGMYLTDRPLTYVVPFILMIFSFGIAVFWALASAGCVLLASTQPPQLSLGVTRSFLITQFFIYMFYTFFVYYVTVMIVAVGVSFWYYQIDKPGLGLGFKWAFTAHLGSLTFAAMVITIIKILQSLISNKKKGNACSNLCRSICLCFLKFLEMFMKTMNRLGVIIMAFTGEQYITSCKSAAIVVWNNLAVFTVVTIVSNFFYYTLLIICTAIPTAISIAVYNTFDINTTDPDASNFQWTLILFVALSSLFISNVFLTTFTQTLTSVFVFYCLDLQLQEYGIKIVNVPSDMQLLLEHAFDENEEYRESFVQKKRNEGKEPLAADYPSADNIAQPPYQQPPPGYQPPYYATNPYPTQYAGYPPQGPPPAGYPPGYPPQQPGYYQPPPGYYQPPPPQ